MSAGLAAGVATAQLESWEAQIQGTVGPWEGCASITIRYPNKSGRQLQNAVRRQYVKTDVEIKQLFTSTGAPSLISHPAQRALQMDKVRQYRKIMRSKGWSVGGRGEIVVVASPDDEIDYVVAGQHVAKAFYLESAASPDNPQILSTIEEGIRVTRLFPESPEDVVRFFRDDNHFLNKVKGGLRSFLEKLDDVPQVQAAVIATGCEHTEEEEPEVSHNVARSLQKATTADKQKAAAEYDAAIAETLNDIFPDMYDNVDQYKLAGNCAPR